MSESVDRILASIQELDPDDFEELIAEIWDRRGWETELTAVGRDRGIDIIATREDPYPEKVLIQAKRYRPGNRVSSVEIQQYASLKHQERGVDQVVVATSSGFSDPALMRAEDLNVKCLDGATVTELLLEYGDDDLSASFDLIDTGQSIPSSTEPIPSEESKPDIDAAASGTDYSGVMGSLRLMKDFLVMPFRVGYQGSITSQEDVSRSSDESREIKSGQTTFPSTEEGNLTERIQSVTVEFVGLERIETTFRRKSRLSAYPDLNLAGIGAAFRIFSGGTESCWIDSHENITIYDSAGGEYHPAALGSNAVPRGWNTHVKKTSPIEFPAGGTENYFVACSIPPGPKIEGIELLLWEENEIVFQFDLDHRARQQIAGLPEEVKSHLEDKQ